MKDYFLDTIVLFPPEVLVIESPNKMLVVILCIMMTTLFGDPSGGIK